MPAPDASIPRARRLLVVDDDAAIGAVLRRLLRDWDVTYAQSPAGALGRIGSGASFAAIVCDVRMPGMDGIQFHAEVARLDARLARRIVYVTGGAGTPELSDFLRRSACACLEKPFDVAALRQTVAAAADAP